MSSNLFGLKQLKLHGSQTVELQIFIEFLNFSEVGLFAMLTEIFDGAKSFS